MKNKYTRRNKNALLKWSLRRLVPVGVCIGGLCFVLDTSIATKAEQVQTVTNKVESVKPIGTDRSCQHKINLLYLKPTGAEDSVVRIPVEEVEETEDPFAEYTTEELDLLVQLAMAEAEGEDVEGKAHVIRVVLNRVQSDYFPDTVAKVIYQRNQFTSVNSERWALEPTEECYDALDLVFHDNWDDTNGALYFEATSNGEDTWHSRNLEYLYTHGNHRFYTHK